MTYLVTFILISFSALFSGLTLGLMSLGPHELKRKMALGDKKAKKIYEVRKNGNQLLVTLLVGNVLVNSILSVFLGSIATGIVAVVSSTALITIFGEILPQASFSRYAMELGARTSGIVKVLLFIFYPISKPISWLLDATLGEELPTIYSKRELVEILGEHVGSDGSDVKQDEERIARGALTFGDKTIEDIMTPRSMLVALEKDEIITKKVINHLKDSGISRFPVYEKLIENIVGMMYLRDLVGNSPVGKKVSDFVKNEIIYVNENENLDHALNAFIKTKNHLFVVINNFSEMVGVLSIEDVLEEIIGEEIVDEFDKYDNIREVAEKSAKDKIKSV